MSLGLGHRYWVRFVQRFEGDLNACLDFMKNYHLKDGQWFEFQCMIKVLNGVAYPSNDYIVDVVVDGK